MFENVFRILRAIINEYICIHACVYVSALPNNREYICSVFLCYLRKKKTFILEGKRKL